MDKFFELYSKLLIRPECYFVLILEKLKLAIKSVY